MTASGESRRNLWSNLHRLRPGDEVKFVLADRGDYDWAVERIREHGLEGTVPVLFSPVHGSLDAGTMARWVVEDGLAVRVQVQMHKVLWPAAVRGV